MNDVGQIRRVTLVGLAANVTLAVAKGVIGFVCSSQALIADALHSVSDMVTDVAVILGVRYWAAPADDEHPYGHGKIQAMVTLFIAIALVVVAWELGEGAGKSLLEGSAGHPGVAAFLIAVLSVAVKEFLFRWTRRVARTVKSPALEANAWHHRSDALSSIPVAAAVAVSYFFPSLHWADAVGALVVGVFILHVSWEIAKPALQELVDAGIDDKSGDVAMVARAVPGVLDVHRVRARRYGGAFQADLHVIVDSNLTIAAGHALGHEVKHALLAADIGVTDAVIHVEPRDLRAILSLGSNVEPRREYLEKAIAMLSALPCTHFVVASSVIETEPVDVPPEYAHLKFLNQVAVFETALDVHDFAARMHAVEGAIGRVRTVKNGPRTIDIDLIDFDGMHIESDDLTLPHPRAAERDFVQRPLAELGLSV